MNEKFDCVVIGGGPGGASTATILADHGRRVLVLEKTTFPRFHIGESLMPQSYWSFKRLGMLDKLNNTDFVRKESVQFISASGKESAPFYFTDRDPNEWSVTWQVPRDRFDEMLLENAREHGAEVRFGARVSRVRFEGDKAIGVTAVIDGKTVDIDADVVVDASGQTALLARQLQIATPDPQLKKGAIYAHFKGAYRDPGRDEGATIIIHTADSQGWFWYIPLPNDIVSIGMVSSPHYLFTGRGDDPAVTLRDEIAMCAPIQKRVAQAQWPEKVYVTSDFSYRAGRIAGDGWVLVGDAFGFLDPVYSSGVFLALKSGELAADAIHEALAAGDAGGERLNRFGEEYMRGMSLLRNLVYAFYDHDFSIGRFTREHPQFHDHIVRLLIGDVFQGDVGEVFGPMSKVCRLPDPIKPVETATRAT